MNVLGYMKRYGIHRCFREKEGEWDVFVSRSCGCNETQGSRHRTHERGSEAASVCAELRCGGGQIVKTGAPQRLSLSKGKLYSIPHPLLYSSYSVEMQTSPLLYLRLSMSRCNLCSKYACRRFVTFRRKAF